MNAIVRKLGRPRKSLDDQRMEVVTVRLSQMELQDLDSACAEFGVNRSKFMRYILSRYLEPLEPFLTHHIDEDSPLWARAVDTYYHESKKIARFE